MKLTNTQIDNLISYIKKFNNKFDIYGVNVHGVGFEYRLYANSNLKVSYLSLEDIMDNRFSLYVDDINDKHYSFTLTESQYRKLDSVINVYWKKTGKRFEDRGLY